jgi:hypothetical protein
MTKPRDCPIRVRWGRVRVLDRSGGISCRILAKKKVNVRRMEIRRESPAEMQAKKKEPERLKSCEGRILLLLARVAMTIKMTEEPKKELMVRS